MLRRSPLSSLAPRCLALIAALAAGACVKQDAPQRPPAEHTAADAPASGSGSGSAASGAAASGSAASGSAASGSSAAASGGTASGSAASGSPYYACRHATADVLHQVRDLAIVMDASGSRRAALADWQAVEAGCRDGRWYLAAALLIGDGKPDRVTADGVAFASARAALEQGLSAEPDSPDLLGYVAYGNGVAAAAYPALPADACARLTARLAAAPAAAGGADQVLAEEATASRAYVCAVADLRAGKLDPALTGFADAAAAYPDAVLRRVELLARAGKTRRAHELAPDARRSLDTLGPRFGCRPSELESLRSALAAATAP